MCCVRSRERVYLREGKRLSERECEIEKERGRERKRGIEQLLRDKKMGLYGKGDASCDDFDDRWAQVRNTRYI